MCGNFHIIKVTSRAGTALFTIEAMVNHGGRAHKEVFEIALTVPHGASEEDIALATQLEAEKYLALKYPPQSTIENPGQLSI